MYTYAHTYPRARARTPTHNEYNTRIYNRPRFETLSNRTRDSTVRESSLPSSIAPMEGDSRVSLLSLPVRSSFFSHGEAKAREESFFVALSFRRLGERCGGGAESQPHAHLRSFLLPPAIVCPISCRTGQDKEGKIEEREERWPHLYCDRSGLKLED